MAGFGGAGMMILGLRMIMAPMVIAALGMPMTMWAIVSATKEVSAVVPLPPTLPLPPPTPRTSERTKGEVGCTRKEEARVQDVMRDRYAGEEPQHAATALEPTEETTMTLRVPMVVGMSGAMAADTANSHTVGTPAILKMTLSELVPGVGELRKELS